MKISRDRVVEVIDKEIRVLEEKWRECHRLRLFDDVDDRASKICILEKLKEQIQQLEDET